MNTLNEQNGLCEVEAEEQDMDELVRKLKAFGLHEASSNLQSESKTHTEFMP